MIKKPLKILTNEVRITPDQNQKSKIEQGKRYLKYAMCMVIFIIIISLAAMAFYIELLNDFLHFECDWILVNYIVHCGMILVLGFALIVSIYKDGFCNCCNCKIPKGSVCDVWRCYICCLPTVYKNGDKYGESKNKAGPLLLRDPSTGTSINTDNEYVTTTLTINDSMISTSTNDINNVLNAYNYNRNEEIYPRT